MRQALAGMLWSKQYYYFHLDDWLSEHQANFLRGDRKRIRNRGWFHMVNDGIISMPDKWEYPWYAAWDLALHTIALGMVDRDFAREQLDLMLSDLYLHPSGQIPAYEWNFGDVNPPVHAFATLFNYVQEKQLGSADVAGLEETFQKAVVELLLVGEPEGRGGNNVFEGGFLGLDNIGVFDRSAPLPTGGTLEQADGTAWMASSARTCWRSRWSWPGMIPATRTSPRSSWSTFSGSRRRWTGSASMRTSYGTRRTASSTTCSGFPTARPSASRSAPSSGCCHYAPTVVIPAELHQESPAVHPTAGRLPGPPRVHLRKHPSPEAPRRGGPLPPQRL